MDVAVRPIIYNINQADGVRFLGKGLVHRVDARNTDIHIRSSVREVEVNAFGDGADADEVEADEVESGSRIPAKMPDPKRPTQEEVDQHDLTPTLVAVGANIVCVVRAGRPTSGTHLAKMGCRSSIWTIAS